MSSAAPPCPFKKQAKHNEEFHESTCQHFPNDFYDWKITTLFYVSIHYVKALANQLGVDVGGDHYSIRNNIKPPDSSGANREMSFTKNAYGWYDYLYRTSQMSRYNGFIDRAGALANQDIFQQIMQQEHKMCEEALDKLKRYIVENRGLKIDN